MRPPRRRRRTGESGQGFWEWMVVGLFGVGVAGGVLVLGGGYLAVTYDQHSSRTALNATAAATPTPEPPSVVFVDFSPVGLNEACVLKAAAAKGLTWDGGELGWSSASNPRPRTSDPDYTAKLRAWRTTMTGLLSAASNSPDWQACLKPELTPPPQRTQEPTEAINVDGTYTIDPAGVQAIGGCGSDVPSSMTVGGGGTSATVRLGSQSFTLGGTFDKTSNSIQVQSGSSNGTTRSLRGSFSSNAGVTRFDGEYEITDATAGCGYQFTAEKH
ncbi:MAG TPA: hypothetical protein VFC09_15090 [Candidatus Dormibacteraeota bacterium]|nr:hypothetical protein [Candidatus Dormibacteraeota bacterium]